MDAVLLSQRRLDILAPSGLCVRSLVLPASCPAPAVVSWLLPGLLLLVPDLSAPSLATLGVAPGLPLKVETVGGVGNKVFEGGMALGDGAGGVFCLNAKRGVLKTFSYSAEKNSLVAVSECKVPTGYNVLRICSGWALVSQGGQKKHVLVNIATGKTANINGAADMVENTLATLEEEGGILTIYKLHKQDEEKSSESTDVQLGLEGVELLGKFTVKASSLSPFYKVRVSSGSRQLIVVYSQDRLVISDVEGVRLFEGPLEGLGRCERGVQELRSLSASPESSSVENSTDTFVDETKKQNKKEEDNKKSTPASPIRKGVSTGEALQLLDSLTTPIVSRPDGVALLMLRPRPFHSLVIPVPQHRGVIDKVQYGLISEDPAEREANKYENEKEKWGIITTTGTQLNPSTSHLSTAIHYNESEVETILSKLWTSVQKRSDNNEELTQFFEASSQMEKLLLSHHIPHPFKGDLARTARTLTHSIEKKAELAHRAKLLLDKIVVTENINSRQMKIDNEDPEAEYKVFVISY